MADLPPTVHVTSGDGYASVSTVAGGGNFPETVFPPGLSRRSGVPATAVLSMSRLQVFGIVAHVVADIPLSSVEVKVSEGGGRKPVWDKWSNNGMEEEVVKLAEDVGAAMLFLQSKVLCIIPISIATTIFQSHHQNEIPAAKPEPNAPS